MIENRRIRESAPIRKSMSMSKDDALRADELEHIFTLKFPAESPFSFSKTMSKALEIAYLAMKGTQESDIPAQVVPNIPESQTTLCLEPPIDAQEASRTSNQTESSHDVRGSANIPRTAQKAKPSNLAKKWKRR